MLSDVTLYCNDCDNPFLFTVGQQQFYASRGITNIPSRCPTCQARHKARADQTLTCNDCNQPFVFTRGEQEFYEKKGMTAPTRCSSCRAKQKAEGTHATGSNSQGQPRQMYDVFCADCGTQTKVPFQPKPGRPVYCRDCYQVHKPIG